MKYSLTFLGMLFPVFLSAQITDFNGSIGIGITTPAQKLDVAGNIVSRGALISSISDASLGGRVSIENPVKIQPGQAKVWTIYNMAGDGYGNSLQFWAYDNAGCTGGGMCAARLIITDDGRVGIGTARPQSELAVAGTVTAKRVKVTLGDWADYVFEPGYKLPSLAEVQQHITTHKHLPDIPSAATIEQEGLDLGDMQRKQMQKIEELTLYILQQQKEIEALKAAVKALSDKAVKP
ncbi:hypothetical protein HHL17_25230 [Chitinophaga sp. G-6-1-13]|uniref:DUF4468 domain-containing protein n=1 Tax=Chitinophaga fulva TaxID=2728842 RepID=A0A848GQ59_9BACT|nr:hypothetical protein [Chitinophaga fulva]NML40524.1 hypothetical protein [Chitinophaga fulva]